MATATITREVVLGDLNWQTSAGNSYDGWFGHYYYENQIKKASARTAGISLTSCEQLVLNLSYNILPNRNNHLPIIIEVSKNSTLPKYVLYSYYSDASSGTNIEQPTIEKTLYYNHNNSNITTYNNLTSCGNVSNYWNQYTIEENCVTGNSNGTATSSVTIAADNRTSFTTSSLNYGRIFFYPTYDGRDIQGGGIHAEGVTLTINFTAALTGTYYIKFITPRVWHYDGRTASAGGEKFEMQLGAAIQLSTPTTLSYTPHNTDVTLTYTRGSLPTNAKKNGTGANFSVPSAVTIEAGTSTALAAARSGTYWVNGGTQTTYTLTPQAKTGLTYTPATGQSVKTVITKFTQPSTSAWQIGSTKYNSGASYTPTTSTSVVAQFTTTTTTSYANTLPTISGSTATANVNGYKVTFRGNSGTPTSSTSTAINVVSTAYSASGTWSTSTNGTAINNTTAFSTASTIYPLGYTATTTTEYGSVTLPTSSTYKRTNYTLLGWSTNSAATTVPTSMHPGKTYTPSANVTLYAIWQANTSYTITFDDNLPTWFPYTINGIPSNVTSAGASIKISSTKPTTSFQTFLAWYLNSAGTGTSYAPGATVTLSSSGTTTLYAKWQAAITVNDNGTLRPIYGIYTNNNGTITTTTAITVNDNGTLRNFN